MWLGGFSGAGFDRAEFVKWLSAQKKPSWCKFLAIHATGAPYTLASVGAAKRMANLANYYKNQQRWKGGPHFFAMGTKVYPGTPVEYPSVHSPSWNNTAIAIECEGDYRKTGKHSHLTGPGAINWETMAWTTAELLKWLGLVASPSTVRFHKEDTRTSHRECPGNIEKDWFLSKVKSYLGDTSPAVDSAKGTPEAPVAVIDWKAQALKQLFDLKEIQERLKAHGFDPGPIDGLMGPKTDSAIRAHQASLTIGSTDVVGPWQMGKLMEAPKLSVNSGPLEGVPALPLAEMHISKAGLDLIKHFEGLRLIPYDDVGSLAIGYGHSNRSLKPPVVTPDLRITEQEAEEILARDLIDYENRVKASITVPLKQHQFDALVSIAYNWGPGNLDRSELRKMVNAESHVQAEAEIRTLLPPKTVKHYKGILRRRNKEADLYGGK
jgi:lysozyme